MKRALVVLALAMVWYVIPAFAQREPADFLTPDEVFQIREAQDPNDRLKMYVAFAKVRLEAVSKALRGADANRAELIHDTLAEYDRILEAIDLNVDQYDKKHDIMRKGLEHALNAEPEFLKWLTGIRDTNPKDLEEFRFVLTQAIDNTKDSIDTLAEVLKKQPKGRKEEQVARKEAESEKTKAAAKTESASKPASPSATPSKDGAVGKQTWDPNVGPPTKKKNPPPPKDQNQ